MGNVVRIGDSVSCGDHSAVGSKNVFCEGMPVTHAGKKTTTGHGCFPPTVFVGPWSSTVFVNNQPVAIKGKTKITPHKCGKKSHDGIASSSASTVSIEA
jgi:uncharacterized Zn-binding protein involved in type VI secretion